MDTLTIPATEVRDGDMLPGVGNGYVYETEEGNGYLSYPKTGFGVAAAMPGDTVLITFHDCEGNENYLLLSPECMVTVQR